MKKQLHLVQHIILLFCLFSFSQLFAEENSRNECPEPFSITTNLEASTPSNAIEPLVCFLGSSTAIASSACDDNGYIRVRVPVDYFDAPVDGTIIINGQSFSYPGTSGSDYECVIYIPGDGNSVDINGFFLEDTGCNFSNEDIFTATDCGTVNTNCFIEVIERESQTDCKPNGTFDMTVRIFYNKTSSSLGNINILGQVFTPAFTGVGAESFTLTNLPGTGGFGQITAFWTGNTSCNYDGDPVFYVAPSCTSSCLLDITGVSNVSGCDANGNYSMDVTIAYTNAVGNIILEGQTFTPSGTSGTEIFTLNNLPGNGSGAISVSAFFAGQTGCADSFNSSAQVPDCDCSLDITNVGNPSSCDSNGDFAVQVSVSYTNAAGNIIINGQTFTPSSTSGSETFTLTNLNGNGASNVNVSANFSGNTSCSDTFVNAYNAPDCSCTITITGTGEPTTCSATGTYNILVAVSYSNPSGDIVINGTSYATTGSGNQLINVTGLIGDGEIGVDITASFSGDPSCSFTLVDAFDAPSCGCTLNIAGAGTPSACSASGTYSVPVSVSYSESAGQLSLNGQLFTVNGTGNQTFVLTGLTGDGNPVSVNGFFVGDTDCSDSVTNLFTAPNCECTLQINGVGTASACNSSGNFTFEVSVSYTNAAGNIVINGQTFVPSGSNGTGVFTLTLPGDGTQNIGIAASFSGDSSCNDFFSNAIDAPDCSCSLQIVSLGNPSACNTGGTFSLPVTVSYANPEGNILINGQSFSPSNSISGTETFTLTGLAGNGTTNNSVTATFSNDAACTDTQTAAYNSPDCECSITVESVVSVSACDANGQYTAQVNVSYENPVGSLIINGQSFSTNGTGNQTFTLTNLVGDGTQDIDISAFFAGKTSCNNTLLDALDAPQCECTLSIVSVGTPICTNATTYSVTVEVQYENPAGQLNLNGQNFTTNGSGNETFTIVGLSANGQTNVDILASFVGDSFCSDVANDVFDEPNCQVTACNVSGTVIASDQTDCNNPDGQICFTMSGGTAPYTFSPSNGVSFNSATQNGVQFCTTGLSANTYSTTATDAQGCIFSFNNIEIIEDPIGSISFQAGITAVSYCENSDGVACITISGGEGPYTLINNGVENYGLFTDGVQRCLTGLFQGNYNFTIIDGNDCEIDGTYSLNIPQQAPLTYAFTTQDLTACEAQDGQICFTFNGGSSPYNITTGITNFGPFFQGVQKCITGLGAAQYNFIATDSRGCDTFIQNEIELTEPECPTCSISNIIVTNISQCTAGAYNLTVNVTYADPAGDINIEGTVFPINGTGNQNFTLNNIVGDGTTGIDITAFFVGDSSCSLTETAAYDEPDCSFQTDCEITINNIQTSACDAQGEFYVNIQYSVNVPTASSFTVTNIGGAINYGTFNYGDNILLGPFTGDGTSTYEFTLTDDANSICTVNTPSITAPTCEPCNFEFTNLLKNPSSEDCDGNDEFTLIVGYSTTSMPGTSFTITDQNGGNWGTYTYGSLVEIGPFLGDGATYQFTATDTTDPNCASTVDANSTYTAPICLPCAIAVNSLDVSACDANEEFTVTINYTFSDPTGNDIIVTNSNGMTLGIFPYGAPIVLGPFAGDGATPYTFTLLDDVDLQECSTISNTIIAPNCAPNCTNLGTLTPLTNAPFSCDGPKPVLLAQPNDLDISGLSNIFLEEGAGATTISTNNNLIIGSPGNDNVTVSGDNNIFISNGGLDAVNLTGSGNTFYDESNYTFQWFRNSTIVSSDGEAIYCPTESGDYVVNVTFADTGCSVTWGTFSYTIPSDVPNAGEGTSIDFCANNNSLIIDLNDYLSAGADADGVWTTQSTITPPNSFVDGVLDATSSTGSFLFEYTSSSIYCGEDVASFIININNSPILFNESAPSDVCANQGFELSVEIANNEGGTITWRNAITNEIITNPANVMIENTSCNPVSYSFYAEYTPASTICEVITSGSVSVSVAPNPTGIATVSADGCEVSLASCGNFFVEANDGSTTTPGTVYTAEAGTSGQVTFTIFNPAVSAPCNIGTVTATYN